MKVRVSNCSDGILHLTAPFNMVLARNKSTVVSLKDSDFRAALLSPAISRLVSARFLVLENLDAAPPVEAPKESSKKDKEPEPVVVEAEILNEASITFPQGRGSTSVFSIPDGGSLPASNPVVAAEEPEAPPAVEAVVEPPAPAIEPEAEASEPELAPEPVMAPKPVSVSTPKSEKKSKKQK